MQNLSEVVDLLILWSPKNDPMDQQPTWASLRCPPPPPACPDVAWHNLRFLGSTQPEERGSTHTKEALCHSMSVIVTSGSSILKTTNLQWLWVVGLHDLQLLVRFLFGTFCKVDFSQPSSFLSTRYVGKTCIPPSPSRINLMSSKSSGKSFKEKREGTLASCNKK